MRRRKLIRLPRARIRSQRTSHHGAVGAGDGRNRVAARHDPMVCPVRRAVATMMMALHVEGRARWAKPCYVVQPSTAASPIGGCAPVTRDR